MQIAGIDFENPLIIGSSSLTNRVDKLKKLEKAGAGGVTTKTITDIDFSQHQHAAKAILSQDGISMVGDLELGLEKGTRLIREAKSDLKIPVLANIATHADDLDAWRKIGRMVAEAGADGIEIDCFTLTDTSKATRAVAEVSKSTSLPILMKMGGYMTFDYVEIGRSVKYVGASGVSGPNCLYGFYPPGLEKDFAPMYPGISKVGLWGVQMGPCLNQLGVEFALRCAKLIKIPLISGAGVMTWENAIQRMAIGATGVSIVSALYLKGLGTIDEIVTGMRNYLVLHDVKEINNFIGVGLKYYSDGDASDASLVDEGQCSDPYGLWPNRLSNEWWSP